MRLRAWVLGLLAITVTGTSGMATTLQELIMPPVNPLGTPVLTEFHLQDIDAIDDETETVSFAGTLILRWHDARQAYDTAGGGAGELLFNDLEALIDLHPTWLPSVDLLNAAGPFEVRSELLRIRPDGTCTLVRSVNGMAKSRLDLSRFPFDEQQVEIILRLHGLARQEAVLVPSGQGAFMDAGTLRVPQWDVLGATMLDRVIRTEVFGSAVEVPVLVVTIDIARDPVHILRLVVLPLAIIVVLSWSVFW
ncbi:MAG: hypothetical protein JNL05_15930, partial [Flavobacteriales bacterium]|nr:hypothetical protein [Flavobacteriales bacterium]